MSRSSLEHECLIDNDAREPRSEGADGLISIEIHEHADVAFLHRIFGSSVIAKNAARGAKQPAVVAPHQCLDCRILVTLCSSNQLAIAEVHERRRCTATN